MFKDHEPNDAPLYMIPVIFQEFDECVTEEEQMDGRTDGMMDGEKCADSP